MIQPVFKNQLLTFTQNLWWKKGRIVYVWHNKWWLSKNLTDTEIQSLPNLKWDIVMELISCSTINSEWEITWSNQIAQKLSNQLEIPVSWSTEPISMYEWWRNIDISPNSWKTSYPWGQILPVTDTWLDNLLQSIY